MIESISLKFTEKPEPLVVPAQGVTIYVGPNNSGKSLLLREFETSFSTHGMVATKLFNDYDVVWPTQEQVEKDIEKLKKKAPLHQGGDCHPPLATRGDSYVPRAEQGPRMTAKPLQGGI
jgi:hypothetical protein